MEKKKTKISISNAMIATAEALKLGADPLMIAFALCSDGFAPEKVETILRWCQLLNERIGERERTIKDDQGTTGPDSHASS